MLKKKKTTFSNSGTILVISYDREYIRSRGALKKLDEKVQA